MNKKKITKKEAINEVKKSDNKLLKSALKNKLLNLNPVDNIAATSTLIGITAKKAGQAIGIIDPLAFVNADKKAEEIEIPKKGSGKKVSKVKPKTKKEKLIENAVIADEPDVETQIESQLKKLSKKELAKLIKLNESM